MRALLRGDDISVFREPEASGYASHFGFDNRRFDALLAREFLDVGRLRLLRRGRIALGLSVTYVLEKPAA